MRSCTPLTSAPAPRESTAKSLRYPVATVGESSQTRRYHLTPTPVQQLCTYVQSCAQKAFFSFGPCTARFLFGKTEKKMGGALPSHQHG